MCFPGPGAEVAGFESFDAAEADRTLREAAVRQRMNPFECGPLSAVTSLPDPILRDFLMDAGVEPPAAGVPWADWWTATRTSLPDEQHARVWQAADKVRFFEVSEDPDGPQVHVVVDVTWEERDGVHVAERDGGDLIRACRHLKRAGEIARGRATQRRITLAGQHAVDAAPFADCRPSHVPDPFAPGSTRLLRLPRASFSEVVSIPFDEARGPKRYLLRYGYPHRYRESDVCLVMRSDYVHGPEGFHPSGEGCGVPIRAFVDDDRAEQFAQQLEADARSQFNPFRLANIPERVSTRIAWGDDRLLSREIVESCRLVGHPTPTADDWERWWGEHVMSLPKAERDELWDQLRVIFYTVVPVHFEQ
ncbi:hypothetical protein [Gemmata sp.]|uniref:hypothetical protein n=1 Tax=Gemmata sp. TaxID=1914242 RepID=UPI003F730973